MKVKKGRLAMMLRKGQTIADIAKHFDCSPKTVYNHIDRFKLKIERPNQKCGRPPKNDFTFQVLEMTAQGYRTDQIADFLGIAEITVKYHLRKAISKKLYIKVMKTYMVHPTNVHELRVGLMVGEPQYHRLHNKPREFARLIHAPYSVINSYLIRCNGGQDPQKIALDHKPKARILSEDEVKQIMGADYRPRPTNLLRSSETIK